MQYLNPSAHVTPATRRFITVLAFVVALTSVRVQAAQATEVLPEPPAWLAESNETTEERGIVVPKRVPETLSVAQNKPVTQKPAKKKWNTVNAPDLTTPVEYSDEPSARTIRVPVSAYNSEPGQTDSTPFTTADGSQVRDGIVAANFLPHGTRIRIPDQFGNKVFEVHDRMNTRYPYRIDIWMLKKPEAIKWGVRNVKVEVLP